MKPEVHNIAQRHWRRTEPRPQGTSTQNFVPISPAVPEICSRTDRHTDRRVDYNTPHSYRGGVINLTWPLSVCQPRDICCLRNSFTV